MDLVFHPRAIPARRRAPREEPHSVRLYMFAQQASNAEKFAYVAILQSPPSFLDHSSY
jgi:hypothetical protein